MSGNGSSNTPASTWTQCEAYMESFLVGTIVTLSVSSGDLTRELMTVVSPSIETSPDPLSELLSELHDLSPLVPPF